MQSSLYSPFIVSMCFDLIEMRWKSKLKNGRVLSRLKNFDLFAGCCCPLISNYFGFSESKYRTTTNKRCDDWPFVSPRLIYRPKLPLISLSLAINRAYIIEQISIGRWPHIFKIKMYHISIDVCMYVKYIWCDACAYLVDIVWLIKKKLKSDGERIKGNKQEKELLLCARLYNNMLQRI